MTIRDSGVSRWVGCGCMIVVAGVALGAIVALLSGFTPARSKPESLMLFHEGPDEFGVVCYWRGLATASNVSCVKVTPLSFQSGRP